MKPITKHRYGKIEFMVLLCLEPKTSNDDTTDATFVTEGNLVKPTVKMTVSRFIFYKAEK